MRPEYVICLECESPSYVFEWENDRPVEAFCALCGNDDPALFASEDGLEELTSADDGKVDPARLTSHSRSEKSGDT
jgi:hypothetical protein